MEELLRFLANTPAPKLLLISGLVFLGLGVIGKFGAMIELGQRARVAGVVFGVVLMISGAVAVYWKHTKPDRPRPNRPTTGSLQTPERHATDGIELAHSTAIDSS